EEGSQHPRSHPDFELPNKGGNMESCGECLVLEHRLSEANEHYVDLIVQQNRLIRANNREASGLEDAIREARSKRRSVARALLSHRRIHRSFTYQTSGLARFCCKDCD